MSKCDHDDDHGCDELKQRIIGAVHADFDDSVIFISHMYEPEGAHICTECNNPAHDPGFISLAVDTNPHDKNAPVALAGLTPASALQVANRLTRAAELVLESMEDRPDVEREAARYQVPDNASSITANEQEEEE